MQNKSLIRVLSTLIVSLLLAVVLAEDVTITVRGFAVPPHEDWRCNGFVEVVEQLNADLAAEGDSRQIIIEPICDNPGWGPYKNEFVLASDAGEAPDIYVAGHEDVGTLSAAGYILDLTDMVKDSYGYSYPEFADVIDALWDSASYKGRIWAIPQDAEARPLYYSKILLKELGWSDAEVDGLPERIQNGEFTWVDLQATAQKAIDKGVVKAGNGVWTRPKNGPDFLYYYSGFGGELTAADGSLIFDKEAARKVYNFFADLTMNSELMRQDMLGTLEWSEWHSTVSQGTEVLFWPGGTWNWGNWSVNYSPSEKGGQDWLFDNIGYALVPAFEAGRDPITLTHPLVYTVSSSSQHPDLALRLIAAVTTADINTRHAIGSTHLGILKSQADYPAYKEDAFLSDVLYMLDYTTFISNSEYYTAWSNAYYDGIQAVEVGDLSPDDAVDFVVERLQNELRDNVTIR